MRRPNARRGLILVALALLLAALPPAGTWAAPQLIYDDGLAASWSDWSWAQHDLGATAPVHSGAHSISVTYGAWTGLYLHHPGVATAGFTKLAFFIHGGTSGGQQLQVYVDRAGDPSGAHGPEVALPQPSANAWALIELPLADLGAANTTITGITWQGTSGGAQPTLYLDDIALASDESPDGPALSAGALQPGAAPADGSTDVVVRARVTDPQGAGDIASVTLDAGALGRGTVRLRDDGRSNDGAASDGLYGALLTVAPGTPSGEQMLLVTAQDNAGHHASLSLGAFVVLAAPGGSVPAGLPRRIGWGTNEWSETVGADWQVNSGVPWDYVYQYITYDWYTDGWGGDFVGRFVRQAWSKNYIPVVSVYLMLATPPACGESATCYAQKLRNSSAVDAYLSALTEAAREARGAKPAIFQIDPDFYGYMQQLSNSGSAPPGVRPDDPTSYPVALNVPGYPNTLAGFGRRIVDVVHTTAPNVLVAPHASMWATNADPNTVTVDEVASIAQRTAAFIDAMGGVQADLLVVEWSDRDAGSGLRPWWDDTNHDLPRPSRAVLWENALAAASGKPLILWQVPAGNMALDNTCNHYQDNRAAYAFSHPRDLVDAGVIAVLFGGGATCMTAPSTDGGFIAAQGAIAYDPPAAPAGLAAGAASGPAVPLRWNESGEPDIWGYRVSYRPAAGGSTVTLDVGRANATTLVLPRAGSWRVSVAAYDAMGQLGPASAEIVVTTTVAPRQVFVSLVRRWGVADYSPIGESR